MLKVYTNIIPYSNEGIVSSIITIVFQYFS